MPSGTRVALLADPHNPTASAVDPDQLEASADQLAPTCLLVLDQACCESGDPRAASRARGYAPSSPIWWSGTFSKAFGLAEMRVGWRATHTQVVWPLVTVTLPFTRTAPAQAGALAALDQEPESRRRAQLAVAERERLTAGLRRPELGLASSFANFVWLPHGHGSPEYAAACPEAEWSVRRIAGEGVRVMVGLAEGNQAVLEVASIYCSGQARLC